MALLIPGHDATSTRREVSFSWRSPCCDCAALAGSSGTPLAAVTLISGQRAPRVRKLAPARARLRVVALLQSLLLAGPEQYSASPAMNESPKLRRNRPCLLPAD